MIPDKPPANKCPRNETQTKCELQCKYNHFESEELTIDAWELKCLDCGWRDTIGFRSDEMEEEDADICTTQCPFCELKDLPTGINPCGQCKST